MKKRRRLPGGSLLFIYPKKSYGLTAVLAVPHEQTLRLIFGGSFAKMEYAYRLIAATHPLTPS